ncbi:hypothetical protein C0J52_06210 [Blattella germanica]|nr:hypothetical protein C0J52_06210 [Blattella germanica]
MGGGCSSVRTVLWFLVFIGFAVNYMIRLNINIAIVSMVRRQSSKLNNISHSSECIETPATEQTANESNTILNVTLPDESRFDWDEKQQSLILGGFFWLHWVCQVPGGILAQHYGTKLIFGVSNFTTCLLCYLIPFCASLDFRVLVFLRVLQGFIAGLAWPSMHNLTASWIPPNERSKFVTAYMAAFYVTGTLGVMWFIAWWLLVYDTPAQHPRISPSEKEHILNSLGQTVSAKKTGLLSGLPHLCRTTFAILTSIVGDYLLQKNVVSRTNVRKMATAVCCVGQGLFALGLAFSGCNSLAGIICLTAATGVSGAVSTGPLASIIDISPNFSSIMLGITNMVSVIPGFISPIIVGVLTFQNQTVGQWELVFIITAVMLLVPGILYQIFSTSELQEWNSSDDNKRCSGMSVRDIMWYLVFTGFAVNYMVRLNINIGIVSMVKSRQAVSRSRSFFWCFCITQVPGGMLAQRYGTKLVYGLSNGVPCFLSFLIPFCARLDYRALVVLRGLQGFVAGASWPSMHHLASSWIPPNERSKFVTAYMGSSVGAAITYPLCGMLINWFDWPAVYHVTGIIGIIWFIAWWLLVYDSPAQHPRISEKEKSEITKKLGENNYSKQRLPTPWKKMLLSRPMWMNILAQWGNIWGLFTLMTQAPTYFKIIHGWDIRMVSCIGQGLFTLGLVFCGCNSIVAIVFSTVATGISGAVSTGPLASFIDISPNFAMRKQTVEAWRSVFIVSTIMLLIPGILYQLFSSSDLQEWNSPRGWLSKREIMWLMVFLGTGYNYMARLNINIAIVSMVKTQEVQNSEIEGISSSECFDFSRSYGNFTHDNQESGAEANALGGLAWPSLNTMIGLWIPPKERSRFLTSYIGSSVGAVLIYPVCGLLINWFDWPVVFYATAIFGIFWIIPWWLWIYESPDEHPTISEKELLHIKKSLGDTVHKIKAPTPWKAILTSLPMWMNILSQWGNIWGLFLWITQAPTFFQFIHGLDIRTTGMLSGIPHIGRLISAYGVSAICDYLLLHNKMSHTNVRKLAISICCLVQGSLAFCLAFTGCNYIAFIVLLTLATACTGAEAAGALGNLVDLSPNYASIMLGISQSVAVIPGMISPIVVSYFTYQNVSSVFASRLPSYKNGTPLKLLKARNSTNWKAVPHISQAKLYCVKCNTLYQKFYLCKTCCICWTVCDIERKMSSKGWPSKRNILWLMVFLGTGYNYMARLNINIAIVSMVKTQDSEMGRVSSSECFEPRTHTNYTNEIKTSGERFEWDEYKQGMILGAYYWTYWAGQLPAALLSQKFGTKIIFGLSNLGICLCGLFIPFAARLDFRLLIALRTIQGFVGGSLAFCLAFTGCNYIAVIVLLTLATACTGAEAAGALGNLVDLSPNYASIMHGISQSIAVIPGMISPMVVSYFTFQNDSSVFASRLPSYKNGTPLKLLKARNSTNSTAALKMKKKRLLSKRNILWFMVFLGTGYNYMVRLNLNIAIVSMVKTHDVQDSGIGKISSSECFEPKIYRNFTNDDEESITEANTLEERFEWDEYKQGMILGAYYWTYWAGQIPGGILSQKFGTKIVFGLSNLGLCLCGFFIPFGLAWPALNTMVGSSAGAVLIFPICGLLINWFGWPVVFYSTSTVGIIWFTSWWMWIYDSPEEHPTITEAELLYIKKSLGGTVLKEKPPTPWKKILTCFPMWINILTQWGNLWGLFIWITQAPTYFQFVHGLDIRVLPIWFLLRCLVQGSLTLCLAFTGCNYIAAIILLTLATASTGAESAGALGNLVDLSPNYSSVMLGISQSVAVLPGTLSAIVVSYFTYQNQTVEQWQKVFFVSTAVIAIPGFFCLLFTSSELQKWNSPEGVQSEELNKLENFFYSTSTVGIIWFAFWWFLIHDSPDEHPTISEKELLHIKSSLGDTVLKKKTGMLSGIPHVGRMILAYLISAACDYLLLHNKMSNTNVRKLAISICEQTVEQWQKVFFVSTAVIAIPGFFCLLFTSSELQKWNSPEGVQGEELNKLENCAHCDEDEDEHDLKNQNNK